jgi:diadenosine tetraphosphate (Ap4A) HIT family hydrolase
MQFAEHPQHPHIHFHVVPRQPDIPAGNVGPNVFNYLGAEGPERVSEDAMNQLAQAMRERLASVDNDGTEHE